MMRRMVCCRCRSGTRCLACVVPVILGVLLDEQPGGYEAWQGGWFEGGGDQRQGTAPEILGEGVLPNLGRKVGSISISHGPRLTRGSLDYLREISRLDRFLISNGDVMMKTVFSLEKTSTDVCPVMKTVYTLISLRHGSFQFSSVQNHSPEAPSCVGL